MSELKIEHIIYQWGMIHQNLVFQSWWENSWTIKLFNFVIVSKLQVHFESGKNKLNSVPMWTDNNLSNIATFNVDSDSSKQKDKFLCLGNGIQGHLVFVLSVYDSPPVGTQGVKSRMFPPYPQCVIRATKWGGFSYKKVGPVSVHGLTR